MDEKPVCNCMPWVKREDVHGRPLHTKSCPVTLAEKKAATNER